MTTTDVRRAGTAPNLVLSRLAAALNREWQLDYERRRAPAPPGWRRDARLGRFAAVADALVELEDRATPQARVEEVLTALAERAADADADATRVVVQYLMPCLVRVAYSRRAGAQRSPQEALDDLLTVAWQTARAGVELRGRTVKIALLRTIEHRALRQPARVAGRHRRREVLVGAIGEVRAHQGAGVDPAWSDDLVADVSGRALSTAPNAGEDLLRLLAEACGKGVSPSDARLVGSLFLGWATCEAVGAAQGVTDRSVRYRRAAALRRLAEWAA
ncbi:MAG: hypothetical protein CYG61_06090 [Actinobacteria bacterium]|nr:MAG: hypothetical protein CYG61_06090 [Actinomycetota bacterium]